MALMIAHWHIGAFPELEMSLVAPFAPSSWLAAWRSG